MSERRVRLAPANLPEIRDRLCRLIRETRTEPRDDLEPFMRVLLRGSWRSEETLASAPCWWVSSDMEELAIAASDGVPQDVVPETSTGFLVFQRPLMECATGGHASLDIQGVIWSYGRGVGASQLSLGLFAPTGDLLRLVTGPARSRMLDLGLPLAPIHDIQGPYLDKIRDVMLAVWALSSEERLCETRSAAGSWPAGRGGHGPDPMARTVKILVLREPPRSREGAGGEGGAGRYSHRFVVRGFWRNQPCGPGHSERRLTWVAPFVKGPAGAPLVERETVRVWRR